MDKRIKIAIQKKGRLTNESFAYLKSLGLDFNENSSDLIIECKNYPVDIFVIRNSDITSFVDSGVVDFGITGKNLVIETIKSVEIINELDFGFCSLVIAVPEKSSITNLIDLSGLRIATSYPNTLRNFMIKNDIEAKIIQMEGSVEIAPRLGLADAVFDITETGRTLKSNNLKIIGKIMESKAVLIANKNINYKLTNIYDKNFRMEKCFR